MPQWPRLPSHLAFWANRPCFNAVVHQRGESWYSGLPPRQSRPSSPNAFASLLMAFKPPSVWPGQKSLIARIAAEKLSATSRSTGTGLGLKRNPLIGALSPEHLPRGDKLAGDNLLQGQLPPRVRIFSSAVMLLTPNRRSVSRA